MDINWTNLALWTLAYFAVGYLTMLVMAWVTGEVEAPGFYFGMAAFWPLIWLVGIIMAAIWLFDGPPTWVARKGRKWADR